MKLSTVTITSFTFTTLVASQSLCDKYTKALFTINSAENQYKLIVKVVNTALIGNYTPGAKVAVNGILNAGDYQGVAVNLLPYFNGGLLSSNVAGKPGASNFLDGGGALSLAMDEPGNDKATKQHRLVRHLYQYFSYLLGCSQYKKDPLVAYVGQSSMYDVHKFMNINAHQNGYFIQQVVLAAQSFGVTQADSTTISKALDTLFNRRCSKPAALTPDDAKGLQAICINSDCPVASDSVCTSYEAAVTPTPATATEGPGSSALASQLSVIAGHEGTVPTATGSASTAKTPEATTRVTKTEGTTSVSSSPPEVATQSASTSESALPSPTYQSAGSRLIDMISWTIVVGIVFAMMM